MIETYPVAARTVEKPSTPILSVEGLTVVYRDEPAIHRVQFDVQAGESIAVIGPNGAGKSTLFQALLGLLQPRAGTVQLYGITSQQIGYVPQNEGVNWDFPVTVRDVVMMGRTREVGWLRWPSRAQWQAVDAALERVGMAGLRDRQVGELSGGQRRRVFIARALAQDAHMLILDEPFSGVDAEAQAEMMDVLDQLHRDGMTILLSTHDLGLAFRRFDRVMALRQHVIAFGAPEHVYTPETLSALYGGQLTVFGDHETISVFVDDHGCRDC